jgi:hypothetical protein
MLHSYITGKKLILVMKVKSINGRSIEEVRKAILHCMDETFKPTLAIVFTSLKEDCKDLQDLFNEYQISLFGLSSNGEFIDDSHQVNSAVVMLLDMNREWFKIEISNAENHNLLDISSQIGQTGKDLFSNPGFIISIANTTLNAGAFIQGLISTCGKDVTVFGGNPASEGMSGGFAFTNHFKTDQGVIALILDQAKVAMEGEAISGWKPVGTAKTITDCDGSWVKTLDDKPALDILLKYMGTEINFEDEDDLYNQIGAIYPVQILHDDGTCHMLPPLFFNQKEGSFMLAGPVEQGTKIKFSMPPDFEVVDTVIESARQKKKEMSQDVDGMIIFSCLGRLSCLGPMIEEEIKGLIETWNAPTVGFFTFGEFGKVKNGQPMFHGTTVSWVTLKEK